MPLLFKKRQDEIDLIISDLYLQVGQVVPDITILEILEALNIKPYLSNFEDENICGLIEREADGTVAIHVNKEQSEERRTFTLAHELGHFMLHNIDEATKFRIDKYQYSNNSKEAIEETEANYFAGSLLVPKNILLNLVGLIGSNDMKIIADYFGVSQAVILNRLKWIEANESSK